MKKLLFLFSLLFSSLHSEENEPLLYEKHLAKEIYDYCIQNELIDETNPKNIRTGDNSDILQIYLDEDEIGLHGVISFFPKKINEFGGIILGYRDQKLIGYAFFDGKGRDYVPFEPITQQEEEDFSAFLLHVIFPKFLGSGEKE